jgi:hypothetical protein
VTLHSSLLPRYAPIPKTVNGRTRADEKAARDAQEAKDERVCYRKVDQRDGLRCRISGVLLTLGGSLTKAVQRHHLKPRGRGGYHDTANVLTVSKAVHDEIHVKGTLRLSGNADLVNVTGGFCGIKVERLERECWRVVGWK